MKRFINLLNRLRYAAAGLVALAGIVFFVHSVLPVSTNLIANPSAETPNPSNSALPASWTPDKWGTNNATLTYQSGGAHTGNMSLYASMTTHTSGDAKWAFTPVSAVPGDSYTFSDYYQSNTATELDAEYVSTTGATSYAYLKTVPANASWTQTVASFTVPSNTATVTVLHILFSVGYLQTDDYFLADNSAVSAPQVSISAPANNSTVSGTQTVNASASDSQGISSVQFLLDGKNLGPAVTSAPYTYNWDTTTAGNGNHTITAVATDTIGLTTTSAAVTVNVQNVTAPPPPGSNLIANPSVETASSSNPSLPAGWTPDKYGTNNAALTYQAGGAHTGNMSLYASMSTYTSGDAKWAFNPVAVTPGAAYTFSDYYQSNTPTELDAEYVSTTGATSYAFLKTVPASSSWTQVVTSFTAPANAATVTVLHILYSVGYLQTDDFSLTNVSTIGITSPANNANISGRASVAASAVPASGLTVSGVQFQIDGSNLGSPVTSAPYQISWDSTKTSNGTHTLTAVMKTSDGSTLTSAPVTVNVSNQIPNSNLYPNPSLEIVSPSNSNLPQSWHSGHWGTNTDVFTYLNTGHTGSRSVETQITKYTSGSAYWFSNSMAVTPGQMYDFSDYYKSSVISEIDAAFTLTDGSTVNQYIGDAFESPNSWTKFEQQFTAPANAVSVQLFHNIYSVGTLTTDDYSLTTFAYQGLARPIVSLTFDDGYESFFQNGLPLLQKYGFLSTDFIISGILGNDPAYMTQANVQALYAAGEEIGSHTVTHPDLTTLSFSQMDAELKNSQAYLQNLLGVPVKDFAAPYGAINNQVITDAQNYYSSVRGVEEGYNALNNFNPYNILVQNVVVTTPVSQVEQWIAQAKATNTWLVLVYHQVDPTLTNETAQPYNTYPADLDSELAYLKSSGVAVETIAQALAEINSQLGH